MPDDAARGEVDDDDEGYESGPFCRHYNELGYCDEVCACDHKCNDHDPWGDVGRCEVAGCACDSWKDKEATDARP